MAREEEGEGECASAVENYMEQLEEVVRYSLPRDGRMAAFFAESIQATVAPSVFNYTCYTILRSPSSLCVAGFIMI